jgi:hypothetical protein
MEEECNKTLYNRVRRLINIKIANAFRTTSNEALCTLAVLTPVVIKAEEAAKLYSIMRKSQAHEIDHEVQPKDWLHSADSESQNNKTSTLYKYHRRQQERARGSNWNSNIHPE